MAKAPHRSTRWSVFFAVTALLGITHATPSAGAMLGVDFRVGVDSRYGGVVDFFELQDVYQDQTSGQRIAVGLEGSVSADGFGIFTVDYGLLQAYAIARATSGPAANVELRSFSSLEIWFEDDIVFTSPGLPGTPGSTDLSIFIEGGLSASSTPDTFAQADVEVFVTFRAQSSLESQSVRFFAEETGPVAESLSFPINFIFGEPITIYAEIDMAVDARNDEYSTGINVATGVGDFGSTIAWGGISEVRDASGVPLPSWEVTSSSQADYRNAMVPEPRVAALLAATLIGCALARRPRRS